MPDVTLSLWTDTSEYSAQMGEVGLEGFLTRNTWLRSAKHHGSC